MQSIRSSQGLDRVWFVAIPQSQDFTEPQFHFGQPVQWTGENAQGLWACHTGRIIGMKYTPAQGWQYEIQPDPESETQPHGSIAVNLTEQQLKLVQDSASVPRQLQPRSAWLATTAAAQELGLSAEQLRKLRRKGLFRVGFHCRDTSIPGSGLPRWQWHLERCHQALAVPPAKRRVRSSGKRATHSTQSIDF